MGNYNDVINKIHNNRKKYKIYSKTLKATFNKSKTETSKNDDFIIKYSKKKIGSMPIENIDSRRVVFISLIGLYLTWKNMPIHSIYSCLILVPLKQQWLHDPKKYKKEIESSFVCNLNCLTDVSETIEFVELLKWKDGQGCVYWMLDNYDYTSSHMIDPFWYYLSEQLSKLYDPTTRKTYNKINLNHKYWENKKQFVYNVNKSSVIGELYYLPMRFNCIKEILLDSNPTLNIVKGYPNECRIYTNKRYELFDEFENNENMNDWFISNDYNPYDL
eukprot:120000_1